MYTGLAFFLLHAALAVAGLFEITSRFTDQDVGGQSYRIYAISELDAAAFSTLQHAQDPDAITLQRMKIDFAIALSRFSLDREKHFTNGLISADDQRLVGEAVSEITDYLFTSYDTIAFDHESLTSQDFEATAAKLREISMHFKSEVTRISAQNNVNIYRIVEETRERQIRLLIWFVGILLNVLLIFSFETSRISKSRKARIKLSETLSRTKNQLQRQNARLQNTITDLVREKEIVRTKDREFQTAIKVAGIGVLWFEKNSGQITRSTESLLPILKIETASDIQDALKQFLEAAENGQKVLERLEAAHKTDDFSTFVKSDGLVFRFTCTNVAETSDSNVSHDLWLISNETALVNEAETVAKQTSFEGLAALSAGISHDFNNLLAAIISSMEYVAEDRNLAQESRDAIDAAISSAMRGSELADSLSQIGQANSVQRRLVDLDAIETQIVPVLRRLVPDDLNFAYSIGSGMGFIDVGFSRLDAALINIVKNAVEASEPGGAIHLRIRRTSNGSHDDPDATSELKDSADLVEIEIRDEGSGMCEEKLKRIFEPFYTSKGSRGRGIGLSMVRQFVEESGGEISVQSVKWQGTTVTITLPLITDPLEDAVQHNGVDQLAKPIANNKIVLVDDNTELTRVLSANMRKRGLEPTVYGSCDEAIINAPKWRDAYAIVSDLTVPGKLQGDEFLSECDDLAPNARKVLISGNFSALERSLALKNSRNIKLLQKPFSTDQLMNFLDG